MEKKYIALIISVVVIILVLSGTHWKIYYRLVGVRTYDECIKAGGTGPTFDSPGCELDGYGTFSPETRTGQ